MWESDELTPIPSTTKPFYLTSNHGNKFFVKPGKSFVFDRKWSKFPETAIINHKIDKFVISPLGKAALHIPKSGAYVAIHENRLRAKLTFIPIPVTTGSDYSEYIHSVYSAAGESLLVTKPFYSPNEAPSKAISCGADIRGISIADTGHTFAIAMGDHFWVWQQLEECPRGVGFWTDLTADKRFGTNIMASHPRVNESEIKHGFMKPTQQFTLHPALSPDLPANCAVCYQDLCLFDNPDEGKGVLSVTVLLPPSKPFDTLYIFSSVCKFGFNTKPKFERYSTSLPIYEGGGSPCIWWSSCCRMAVIAVSNSIVIVTRSLHILAIVPMVDVLPHHDLRVANVAWSACGQYFLITSMGGAISALTRNGMSMKHELCGLKPFGGTPNVPLMAVGDSFDPGLFVVYNKVVMRPLRIDTSSIPHCIDIMLSLPFPLGSSAPMFKNAVQVISSQDYTDKSKLAQLLFYTGIFQIFPLFSPLRYLLVTILDDAAIHFYDNKEDLFSLLLIRCVLWITGHELPTYQPIIERLGYTRSPVHRHVKYIIEYELARKDYIKEKPTTVSSIKMYTNSLLNMNEEEEDIELEKPDDGTEMNLNDVMEAVREAMHGSSPSPFLHIRANLRPLFDYLVFAGRFDHAFALGSHPSVSLESSALFEEIAKQIGDNVPRLYKAMTICINKYPELEDKIRASCVFCINRVLKKQILETMPSDDGKVKRLSQLIVVEDQFEVVCPDDETQCNDFAVVASVAIAAADYKHCTDYLKREYSLVPPCLLDPIRELFRLLWFVHYREKAIHDMAADSASDTCLRLLGFPDFMNLSIVRDYIEKYPQSNFSADIYAHYINGNKEFDQDPAFIDIAEEWLANMNPRSIRRVISAMECFTDKNDEVPHSKLLFVLLVSHILPYLRCAIARTLTGYDPGDNLPPELKDFDDNFSLPDTEDQNMTIQRFEPQDVSEISDISAGEFHPPIVPPPPPKRKRRKHYHRRRKSDEAPPPPKKKKKPIRRAESSDSDDYGKTLRPLVIDKRGRHRAPMNFDVPLQYYEPYYDMGPQYITPGYMQPVPDIIHGYMDPNPEPAFGPIWDIDPADFVKEEKVEKKAEEPAFTTKGVNVKSEPDEPIRIELPVQRASPKKPKIIYVSRPVPPPQPSRDYNEDTLDLSDVRFHEPERGPLIYQDPFPLDDALSRRVSMLLGEASSDIRRDDLRSPPELPRINIPQRDERNKQFSTTPPTNLHVDIQTETQATQTRYEKRKTEERLPQMGDFMPKVLENSGVDDDDSTMPDFKPRIMPMKGDNIVSMRSNASGWQPSVQNPQQQQQQIRVMQVTQKKAVLREITPEDEQNE